MDNHPMQWTRDEALRRGQSSGGEPLIATVFRSMTPMKLALLVVIVAMTRCSQANRPTYTTYDITAVNVLSADPHDRKTQIEFSIPEEADIQVAGGGNTHGTLFVDKLNSQGTFTVVLSVERSAPSDDGTQTFTTQVSAWNPRGSLMGPPSTYTFKDERSLDDVLAVTAVPAAVPLGVPHTLGTLNGQPITLLVKPRRLRHDGG